MTITIADQLDLPLPLDTAPAAPTPESSRSDRLTILCGDALEQLRMLPDCSVQCCVTSPPYYGLRDYKTGTWQGGDPNCAHQKVLDPATSIATSTLGGGKKTTGHQQEGFSHSCPRCGATKTDRQIGSEQTVDQYIANLVAVFREVRRVLREDGTLWLNLGDVFSYGSSNPSPKHSSPNVEMDRKASSTGMRPKNLLMVPGRVAMALQADGWYLRSWCPWLKTNAMPESVTDRPSTSIESIFMLTKEPSYFYDAEAVKINASNAGKVVQLGEKSFSKGQASGAGVAPSGNGKSDSYTVPPKRSRRSSDWFFESWQGMLTDEESGDPLAFVVNTRPYRAAHFATYPAALVTPMVKASVSEAGCCPECGAPLERIVEKVRKEGRPKLGSFALNEDGVIRTTAGLSVPNEYKQVKTSTLGWKPTCSHSFTTPARSTVLDPFGGSGTTGAVALELGHKAILIELNRDYIPLIRERCGVAEPAAPIATPVAAP